MPAVALQLFLPPLHIFYKCINPTPPPPLLPLPPFRCRKHLLSQKPAYYCYCNYLSAGGVGVDAFLPPLVFSERDIRFKQGLSLSPRVLVFICMRCCGSGVFIPDSGSEFFHPGSRAKKNPDPHQTLQNCLSSRIYDPGCSFRIRLLIFYPSRIPDPWVKRHRIPDPDPQHCVCMYEYTIFALFSHCLPFTN